MSDALRCPLCSCHDRYPRGLERQTLDSFPPPSSKVRVALVGAGRVGTAVAALLQGSGHDLVGVWSRSRSTAERSAEALGVETIELVGEDD